MTYSQIDPSATAGIDSWYFDAETKAAPQHDQHAQDRRVLLGCSFVGVTGIFMLLLVLVSRSPLLHTAVSVTA